MSPNTLPPAARNLEILAGDLLAVAAKRITEQLACVPDWEPMQQLKHALEPYELARVGDAITNATDPQLCTVADWQQPTTEELTPATERSAHHG